MYARAMYLLSVSSSSSRQSQEEALCVALLSQWLSYTGSPEQDKNFIKSDVSSPHNTKSRDLATAHTVISKATNMVVHI